VGILTHAFNYEAHRRVQGIRALLGDGTKLYTCSWCASTSGEFLRNTTMVFIDVHYTAE